MKTGFFWCEREGMGGLRGTENKLPKSSSPSGLSSCSWLITSPGIQRPIPSDSTAQSDSKALTIIPMKKQFRLLAIGQTTIYQCLKAQASFNVFSIQIESNTKEYSPWKQRQYPLPHIG